MKFAAVAIFSMTLLSLGPIVFGNTCESLVKPITISNKEILGRWMYIGGSSDLPGSRSLAHLMTSVWLELEATNQSNVLNIIQTQRIYGDCSTLMYNVTFENSTLLIGQPFYLKEVYLPTDCSDCLVVYEEVASGKDTFTSLLLFSRRQSVEPVYVEMLKKQAACLNMPTPIMINPNYEICPGNIRPSDGLTALNSLLEAKMGHGVARLLDRIFDIFVN